MNTKKLYNPGHDPVSQCIDGFIAVHSGVVTLTENTRITYRGDISSSATREHISIISGGGSGHEPFPAGYVAPGMLTCGVAGDIFASPPPSTVLAAIRIAAHYRTGGVLLLLNNYTGDRLNFAIAAERARAMACSGSVGGRVCVTVILTCSCDDIVVSLVISGEDCALRSVDKTAGRRGLVGLVILAKLAGALEAEGRGLDEIADACERFIPMMGTIGVALTPCVVPGRGASFSLPDDMMELGLGIHGEAGVRRVDLQSCANIVRQLLEQMFAQNNTARITIDTGCELIVVVNNLGGCAVLEQNIFTNDLLHQLTEERGFKVVRVFSGPMLTSLDMQGMQFTLMQSRGFSLVVPCLDAPTSAPGWPRRFEASGASSTQRDPLPKFCDEDGVVGAGDHKSVTLSPGHQQFVLRCLADAAGRLRANVELLNELDRRVGDGDTGSTLGAGAKAIVDKLLPTYTDRSEFALSELLHDLSAVVENSMGGVSGGVYSLFWTRASAAVASQAKESCHWFREPTKVAQVLRAAQDAVMEYGRAHPGDRTMIDVIDAVAALIGTTNSWNASSLDAISKVGCDAAEATKDMRAKAGRASYVADARGRPDPGAVAASLWIGAVCDCAKASLL